MLWEVFLQVTQLFQAISSLPSTGATGTIKKSQNTCPEECGYIDSKTKTVASILFYLTPQHYTSSSCGQSGANFYIRTANPKKKNGSAYYYCVSF